MKSVTHSSEPQEADRLSVAHISRRGFSKLPLVFGKTSMEVNAHRTRRTGSRPASRRAVQATGRARGAGCAGRASPGPSRRESAARTLSGNGAPRSARPSLRLEMGTDGGKMSRGSSGRRDPGGAPAGAARFPSFSHYFRVKL